MNLQQVVDLIAAKSGLDTGAAERAAGTILSVIQQEVDPALAAQLFQKLPGAAELADANAVVSGGGGFISSIASGVLGTKAGVLAAGFAQLQGTGLTMQQIEGAAGNLLSYVKANAGPKITAQVTGALPGLSGSRAA
jgi:hypothetical protein